MADDASITAAREAFVKPSETPALQHPERWGCPTDWPVPGPRTAHYLGIIRSTTATWCGLLRGQRPRATSTRWPRSSACSTLVANEGEPDVVQISDDEPTHPSDFFAVLDAARKRPSGI